MIKRTIVLFSLSMLLFSLSAQTKVMLVDSLFTTLHERGQFSGSAVVVNEGKPLYQRSFGVADREQEIPINEKTLFNTGTVSMSITAVAILQLSEKGMLEVNNPVADYLSGFPYKSITIGHLLTHASGLPEIRDLLPDWDRSRLMTNDDVMMALYENKPELAFDPGRSSLFNNVGYIILAEVVKIISRQDFETYMENNIFYPAGMTRSGIYNASEINEVDNHAKGYFFSPFTQQYEEAVESKDVGNLYSLSGTQGNSNIWSNTEDLLKFCEMLSNTTLLKEETLSKMFLKKTDALMPGQARSYGNSFSYGWIIPEAPFRIALASGSMPGYNAEIVWNLSEKRMIIFTSNDYLSFTSYNNLLPYMVGTILNSNTLMIPRRYASIELTNKVLHISDKEIREEMEMLKKDTVNYMFDVPGIQYLIERLNERGETEKAEVIKGML